MIHPDKIKEYIATLNREKRSGGALGYKASIATEDIRDAAYALGSLRAVEGVPALRSALAYSHSKYCAWALGEILPTCDGVIKAQAIGTLIFALNFETETREHCVKALLKIGEAAIVPLTDAMKDPKINPWAKSVLEKIAPAYIALTEGL